MDESKEDQEPVKGRKGKLYKESLTAVKKERRTGNNYTEVVFFSR